MTTPRAPRPALPAMLLLAAALTPAQPARGQDASAGPSAGWCAWVRAEADADRAYALAPEVYVGAGVVAAATQGGSQADPTTVTETLPRVSTGLRWDVADLRRAAALRDRADAACAAHAAEAELVAWLSAADQLGVRDALDARLRVIEETLAGARSRVEEVERRLDLHEATVADLLDARRRLAAVEDARARTEEALDAAAARPPPPPGTLPEALAVAETRAARLARADHALRDARAWNVELRLGYDQVLGAERDLPFVAFLQASFDLGRLVSAAPHGAATAARSRAVRDDRLAERVQALEGALARGLARDRRRLGELAAHRRALATRRDALLRTGLAEGDAARVERALWFELRALDADAAHLEAHLAAIEARLPHASSAR